MKKTFFARNALFILMIVFFCVPFAMRGARFSLQHMKNDVKDWLPSQYDETGDLVWFKEHFLGEQFVLASWENCHGTPDDATFRMFLQKLLPAMPPSRMQEQLRLLVADQSQGGEPVTNEDMDRRKAEIEQALYNRVMTESEVVIAEDNFIGDELGLYTPHDVPDLHFNWGGQQEKWLRGTGGQWYYITPRGELCHWQGADAPLAALGRWIWRNVVGESLSGEVIRDFGSVDGPWYYANPRRLRGQVFKTVTCGPGVLAALTHEDKGVLRHDPDEALRRLQGTLFGPDGKQTCIFLTLTEFGRRDLHQVCGRAMLGKPLGRLYEVAGESGISVKELRLGGPPVDNVAIDEEGTITLVRLVGLSVVLGLGLAFACFRTISATIMVFFVGGMSAMLSLACVWWFGSSMDAIMMSMPSLVYVLGLSGSVHLMNYYQQAVSENGVHGATEHAVSHAWKPALLCNITTAIGLISLCTSEIVPIRKFGIFSAVGVVVMLLVIFTYLPAALQLWPQLPRRKIEADEESWLERSLAGFWHVLGGWIIRQHIFVSLGCTLFIAVVGYGVTRIETSVNLLKMFDPSAEIIGDYEWLEANLGRLVPMEVVVKVAPESLAITATPANDAGMSAVAPATLESAKDQALADLLRLNFLSRMELTSRVQQVIENEFGKDGTNEVGRAMSAATFAPVLPAARNDLSTFSERRATNKKLDEHRPEFLASDYLRLDREDQSELWRVSVRLAASKKVDYGSFVQNLKNVVQPVLAAYGDRETIIRAIAQRKFEAALSPDPASSAEPLEMAAVPRAINPAMTSLLVIGQPAAGENEKLAATNHRLRTETLTGLLAVARMKVEVASPDASLDAEKISKYDGIVLLGNMDDTTRSLVKQYGRQFIDLNATVGNSSPITRLSAVYTGVVPIVYKAQRALLDSLVQSTLWSFVTITPLMMWVSRSFGAGLVTMLPNVLPVLVIFGAMGWMGIEVDVGSMMTASIALGVAVDDTIHYLTWFREELDKCGDRKLAILRTYEKCATPTFQAALISGLGLSIFAFSTFTPTQRFGYLMLTILWAGVFAELIYFPALLAGPLGWVFKPNRRRAETVPAHGSPRPTSDAYDEPEPLERETSAVVKFPAIKPHLIRHDASHSENVKRSS